MQNDLFGEPRVTIKDNTVLENACNRLLRMVQRDPTLLDGSSMAEIDRRIYGECLWEDGVCNLLSSDKKAEFLKIVSKTQDSEVLSRARRHLLSEDLIRVSSAAIKSGEQFRARISGAMK